MDKVSTSGLKVTIMMENGKTIEWTDLVSLPGLMVNDTKDFLKTKRNRAMGSLFGQMAACMKDAGKMEDSTALAYLL